MENTIDLKKCQGENCEEVKATGADADRITYGLLAAGSLIVGSFAAKMLFEAGQKESALAVLIVGIGGAILFSYKVATVKIYPV